MTRPEIDAISGWLEDRFAGFVLLGLPVDQPFDPVNGPAVRLAHGLTVPKMQRMATMLRMMAQDMEDNIRFWNMMGDGPPPPPPGIPGEEWKNPPQQ